MTTPKRLSSTCFPAVRLALMQQLDPKTLLALLHFYICLVSGT